jgi:hypothetical protein
MRNIGTILLLIATAGCTSGPLSEKRDLESSNQQRGQIVACSGYKAWPDCYRAAQQACPNGFEILNKEENLPTQTRTLRINCK